jgi:hypothetical protein
MGADPRVGQARLTRTVRLSSYERRNEAETAEQRTIKRRLQHGYQDTGGGGAAGRPSQAGP